MRDHMTEQLPINRFPRPPSWCFELLLGPLTLKATLAASVKASLTPRFLIAEHSMPSELLSVTIIWYRYDLIPLRELRTEISQSVYSPSHLQSLLVVNHLLLWPRSTSICSSPVCFANGRVVVFVGVFLAKIALQGDKNQFDAWAILRDLGNPFRLDVFQGVLRINLVDEWQASQHAIFLGS